MVEPEKLSLLERLPRELPEPSGREARVARHLMANYPLTGLKTVAEFPEGSGVSTATVLRLVKRLGFPVYADFQLEPGMVLADALIGAVADRMGEEGKSRVETLEDLRRPFAPPT